MVTRPALGILAAPTLANVAVILQSKKSREGIMILQRRLRNYGAALTDIIYYEGLKRMKKCKLKMDWKKMLAQLKENT